MKIKLVAIAKDEAAYLSEWIFHHLYFGFDELDIYLNFTSDASENLLNKLSEKFPVNLHYVEELIPPDSLPFDKFLSERFLNYNKLQARAYSDAVGNTLKEESFTHIMFLDIDEFWTPLSFNKSIKDVLIELADPDVASFYWKNKVNEKYPFMSPYQHKIDYLDDPHYKTIFRVTPDVVVMNTHRSLHKKEVDMFGDRYNEKAMAKNSQLAFILHRFQRHELEYLSMLGRGDPTSPYEFHLKFTRSGFHRPVDPSFIVFDESLINVYDEKYKHFISDNGLDQYIDSGRQFVIDRKNKVVNYVRKQLEICETINKVIPDKSILDATDK